MTWTFKFWPWIKGYLSRRGFLNTNNFYWHWHFNKMESYCGKLINMKTMTLPSIYQIWHLLMYVGDTSKRTICQSENLFAFQSICVILFDCFKWWQTELFHSWISILWGCSFLTNYNSNFVLGWKWVINHGGHLSRAL